MANINSFSENLAKLTEKTTQAISVLEGINEAMLGEDTEVRLSNNMVLPSLTNIAARLDRAEQTVANFVQGKGVVETNDGTFRTVKVSTISRPPSNISGLTPVSEFSINPNWFFETLQYPRCVIKVDLTDKIDPASDRVFVNRVIISAKDVLSDGTSAKQFFDDNISGKAIGYTSLISLLESNNISYKEDRDEVYLPLTYERYKGDFAVTDIKLVKDANGISHEWLYLDTLNYSVVDENGKVSSTGMTLSVNDYVRYKNSLYKVVDIAGTAGQKRVLLNYAVGYETIGVGSIIEFYNPPFAEKTIEVGIGVNELDIVYVKGVNEEYNLLSKDWSDPLTFFTNELLLSTNSSVSFIDYYNEHVADFGQTWIAQIKEGQIYSSNGIAPNAPVINAEDLNVVQINTQLDATLDKDTYNKLTTEIASTKSNITAIRHTIASNKDLLIQSSNAQDRTNIQNLINTDSTKLNSLTTQYNSLVNELNTLLVEAGAINYSPKYHIRGFFAIPESKYVNETLKLGEQRVIGFEILYRYLHVDETGVKLETYEYSGSDANNSIQTGVFTDWNIMKSSILSKVFDSKLDAYVWTDENPADGSQININQIDIPIRSGEKVEIKVRSISEAGYPYNPLKSAWSNSVIISFPDNLTSDDAVTTILETVKSDMTAVVLQETMSAAGVYTHISDGTSMYKHNSSNVSYTESVIDENSNTSLSEMSVQNKLDSLTSIIQKMSADFERKLKEYETEMGKLLETRLSPISKRLDDLSAKVATLEGYHNN